MPTLVNHPTNLHQHQMMMSWFWNRCPSCSCRCDPSMWNASGLLYHCLWTFPIHHEIDKTQLSHPPAPKPCVDTQSRLPNRLPHDWPTPCGNGLDNSTTSTWPCTVWPTESPPAHPYSPNADPWHAAMPRSTTGPHHMPNTPAMSTAAP